MWEVTGGKTCHFNCIPHRQDTSPNQDNFSVTHFKSGYTLICTFDGHGPFGQRLTGLFCQRSGSLIVNLHRTPFPICCRQNMEHCQVISCQPAQFKLCHGSWSTSLALTKIPLTKLASRRPWDPVEGNCVLN